MEFDAHPAMAFGVAAIAFGSDGIGVCEEASCGATCSPEAFFEEIKFAAEHLLEAVTGDVAFAFAVDLITELHIIGRHAFCDCTSGATCFEEMACDFLSCTDFCEGTVDLRVNVDGKGLAVSSEIFRFDHKSLGFRG